MKKIVIKMLVCGVGVLLVGGIYFGIKEKNNGEKTFTLAEVMAATNEAVSHQDIFGDLSTKSTERIDDYRLDEMLLLAEANPFTSELSKHVKRYANFLDINGDGLLDFLFAEEVYNQNLDDGLFSYRISILTNKGKNKFVIDFNCKNVSGYYYGICADPKYKVQ